MKCTSSKTHVPSPSESFTQSNTSRVKCRPIIPMHSSAGPVFANRAVDSSPLTKRPSCGTTAVINNQAPRQCMQTPSATLPHLRVKQTSYRTPHKFQDYRHSDYRHRRTLYSPHSPNANHEDGQVSSSAPYPSLL